MNEAYLELAGRTHNALADRVHFFAAAAQAMRRILVDYASANMLGNAMGRGSR